MNLYIGISYYIIIYFVRDPEKKTERMKQKHVKLT
jgi:hypothetical protein